jgi:hypothetical protein
MFLYSLTIQPPTAITQAIIGQFCDTKEQQIVTVSGSWLTIHRPDPNLGRVETLVSHDIFGIIRCIASFRLAGSTKDKSFSFFESCHKSRVWAEFQTISLRLSDFDTISLRLSDFDTIRPRHYQTSTIRLRHYQTSTIRLRLSDFDYQDSTIRIRLPAFDYQRSTTSQESEMFLIVGTGKDIIPNPRQFSGALSTSFDFMKMEGN